MPGKRYAIYFPDGGAVTLNLCEVEGTFDATWLDVQNSNWLPAQTVLGESKILLDAPGGGHWVALLSTMASVDTQSVEEHASGPLLQPNFPDPFDETTHIRYLLSRTSQVRLTVFDALGRTVRVLADGTQTAGHHEIEFSANDLAGGTYFYRLETEGLVETRAMQLERETHTYLGSRRVSEAYFC